jgi:small conductance mechanosensitive channel
VTTGRPDIPVDELELLLKPLTKEELVVEAQGWMRLVAAKVAQISRSEIEVKQKNREIDKAGGAAEAVRAAGEDAEAGAAAPGEKPDVEAADAAAREAEQQAEAKTELLESINVLREERTALIDRANVVLEALEAKGGDVEEHRLYLAAVSGIEVDVSDVSAVWHAVSGWLTSGEGGIRWAKNILLFIVTLIVFAILARILGKATQKALSVSRNLSDLLRDFTVKFVRRGTFLVGLMVAITMLEVNIGPVVAVIGAAGFIVAFALQGTLGNFASGLMILAYRPFDVGDVINVAGVAGTVNSMNLVSTSIKTFDNQSVVVPNNSIWGSVITNVTGLDTRRVDMVFGISYSDDTAKAKSILEDILKSHPRVLDEPASVVRLHELGDSSVNFICRPWVKTADYWAVYWDVTDAAKQRFDEEGISIPFPQRDVHVYQAAAEA